MSTHRAEPRALTQQLRIRLGLLGEGVRGLVPVDPREHLRPPRLALGVGDGALGPLDPLACVENKAGVAGQPEQL